MKRIALFPGSFDPLTLGHLDLIERLSRLYDQVVVGVLHNPDKKPFLPVEARLRGIREATAHLDNVTVLTHDGATVELAQQVGAQVIAATTIWRRRSRRCFFRRGRSAAASARRWCAAYLRWAATSRRSCRPPWRAR